MSVTHEEGIKAAERLRGLIVQLQHEDVIRLEQTARGMLAGTAPPEEGACPKAKVTTTIDMAALTIIVVGADATRPPEEIVAQLKKAIGDACPGVSVAAGVVA